MGRASIVLDCCYSCIPSVSPTSNFSGNFPKVSWGQVDYKRLRDFISRPRFLELPILPVQHASSDVSDGSFPKCWLHVFGGCRLEQWCAEFPIEGTVQGAFTWAFIRA